MRGRLVAPPLAGGRERKNGETPPGSYRCQFSSPEDKKTTTLIYGERLVLSEVEGLVLKARPEGSRTMVKRIGCMFVERRRGELMVFNQIS